MKARAFDPRRLEVELFAAQAGHLEGRWALASFERLPSLPRDDAFVEWQADGEQRVVAGAACEVWLRLRATATVALPCQRCLAPVEVPLDVDRRFRFARDEAAAEALDAELEDDVLALTHALDLQVLVEDELLLAVPLVPRHESCPDGGPPLQAGDAAAPSPFAALAALKTRGGAR
jgi:uncharacterized protein